MPGRQLLYRLFTPFGNWNSKRCLRCITRRSARTGDDGVGAATAHPLGDPGDVEEASAFDAGAAEPGPSTRSAPRRAATAGASERLAESRLAPQAPRVVRRLPWRLRRLGRHRQPADLCVPGRPRPRPRPPSPGKKNRGSSLAQGAEGCEVAEAGGEDGAVGGGAFSSTSRVLVSSVTVSPSPFVPPLLLQLRLFSLLPLSTSSCCRCTCSRFR